MASHVPEPEPALAAYFAARRPFAEAELRRLRAFVFRVADETPGVGPLSESLKWGEPSYAPRKPGVGSSVRLAELRDGSVAVHFICHTGLIDHFRAIYPQTFAYEGNRSILLREGEAVDETALAHCVGMALTYHLAKRGR